MDSIERIIHATNNFTKILPTTEIKEKQLFWWGTNGVGDRWANKKFNYSVIYEKKHLVYTAKMTTIKYR